MSDDEFPMEEIEDQEAVSPVDAKPLVDIAGKPIEEGIKQLISTRKVPHLREIIDCLVEEWGGPQELAKAMVDTYKQAPAGSTTRSRILEKTISFMQIFVDEGGEDELDNDTLVAYLMEEMKGGTP